MKLEEVLKAGYPSIARDCWTGFHLDVSRRELVSTREQGGMMHLVRQPFLGFNEAEKTAKDWRRQD